MRHTDVNGPLLPNMDSRCWVFLAHQKPNGYGQIWLAGKAYNAHRVSFFIEHGRWPGAVRQGQII